jgi:hypothetical protein
VGWAAPSSHYLPRLGLNRPRRPNLTVHDAPALAGRNTSKQCLCFQGIPTKSSAASVRTFKLHNVNLVLCRPLLHLPNLPVLVHVVAITCFAMENACAPTCSQIQIQWHSPTIFHTANIVSTGKFDSSANGANMVDV